MIKAVVDKNVFVAGLLVTKNTKHFPAKQYQAVRIVTVSKFLDFIEQQFPE